MGRIINTLRYGRAKTKTFIISVFVLMVAAIVLGIIGINRMNIIMLGISMVLFIICIIMVFKLESVTKEAEPEEAEDVKPGSAARGRSGDSAGHRELKAEPVTRVEGSGSSGHKENDRTGTSDNEETQSLKVRPQREDLKRSEAEEKLYSALRGKSRGPKAIRANLERKLLAEIIKANKRSAVIEKKLFVKRMKEASKARRRKLKEMRAASEDKRSRDEGGREDRRSRGEDVREDRRSRDEDGREDKKSRGEDAREDKRSRGDDLSEERSEKETGENERLSEKNPRSDRMTDYKTYTKSEFKRLRKVYKIPKDACRIVIDSCKSLAIDHAPALFWAKKGRFYILAFEETARCETLPMTNTAVSYKKNIREDGLIKYNAMREMGVYKEFEDMMPTFSIHGGATGNEYFKNIYVIGKDLEVTPRSLRSLMTQFDFKIQIFDSLGIKGGYSKYFKKAYEQRIMWTDGVISQSQYQNNIRDILQSMVDDDSIIRYDFMEDLGKMVHHRLITDEYAEFYKNKR